MPEATTQSSKPKTKSQIPPFTAFPGVEAPAAFRDIAEKSLSQAKDSYEKMKSENVLAPSSSTAKSNVALAYSRAISIILRA